MTEVPPATGERRTLEGPTTGRPTTGRPTTERPTPGRPTPGRPLRIAMVAACPLPYPRGTPVRAARMAEALARSGHEVHVVTYHLGRGELSDGVTVHRIRHVPSYTRLAPGPSYQKLLLVDTLLYAKLRDVLRSMPFDIVHAHHYEGLIVAALARRGLGIPLIYDAHTLLFSELPYYRILPHLTLRRTIGAALDRRLPHLADHVIAVTPNIRDYLSTAAGLDARNITVIGNGVEARHFSNHPPATVPASDERTRTLVFAGNLAPYQGIELMLRSFRIVVDRCPETRLLIVSEDDTATQDYESVARELGLLDRVDFVQSDFDGLPALLRGADVALNPRPPCDGLPLKLLNYMAAAKPIVSFAGSAKGLVHGRTACVVPDNDIHAFASGVLELLADPELGRALGRRAREIAVRDFSWETIAARVDLVYRGM